MNHNMAKSQDTEKEIKEIWGKCRITGGSCGHCPDSDLLAAYLDHRLSGSQAEEVERHLLKCPSCLETSLVIRQVLDAPEEDALSGSELQQLFDLVPQRPGLWRKILEQIAERLSSMAVPAPAFALSIFLVCGFGFYTGMQTWLKQEFFHEQIAAELDFFFDNPAIGCESSGEKG